MSYKFRRKVSNWLFQRALRAVSKKLIIFIILVFIVLFFDFTSIHFIASAEKSKEKIPEFTPPAPESASEDFLIQLRLKLGELLKKKPDEKQLDGIGFLADYYGLWDISIKVNSKLIKMGANDSAIYNNLGRAYMNVGELKEAEKYLRESLKIQPDNFFAFYNLGILYRLKKDYKRAIEYLKKATELAPQWGSFYADLGDAYYEMKDYDKVIENYERAISLGENDVGVYGLLGVAYFEKGDKKEALRIVQKGLKLYPDDEILKSLIEIFSSSDK